MSRILNEQQQMIQDSAREYAQGTMTDKVKAGKAEAAKTGAPAAFGYNTWSDLAELGFIGMTVPEQYGGSGLGAVEEMLVMEELAKVSSSVATNIDAHNLCINTILQYGTEDQKQRYLVPGAKGEKIGALASTDPAGSSNFPEWTISVKEDGDDYILNGSKMWCSNSQVADFYAVMTKTETGPGPMDCYIVEKDFPGVEMGELEFAGTSGTNTGTVYFNDVRVPKANKIPPNDLYTADYLALGYLNFAAIMLGAGQAAFDKTLEYTKNRSRRGIKLAENQAVAHRLANMAIQIETARSVSYDAAELADAGQMDRKLNSIAKIASADMVREVGYYSIALHGAVGTDPEVGVLETYILAAASWSGEFPNDLHRDMIARDLGIDLESL